MAIGKTGALLVGLAVTAAAPTAHGSFIGFQTEVESIGDGRWLSRVYALFNDPNDTLLSIFNIQFAFPGLPPSIFHHNDLVGASWSPQFALQEDSWVTIGGGPGFANTTQPDPNWGPLGFNQPGLVVGSGWFNANPQNLQGQAGPSLRTLIMHVVHDVGTGGWVLCNLAYNQGVGTPTFFAADWVSIGGLPFPAPGAAVACCVHLLLAVQGSRRRRI